MNDIVACTECGRLRQERDHYRDKYMGDQARIAELQQNLEKVARMNESLNVMLTAYRRINKALSDDVAALQEYRK